jgi:glycosyltransferase involved in cell wall biosynthesis
VSGIGSFRNFYGHDLPDRFRWFRAWLNTVAISTAVCNSRETALDVQQRARKRLRVVYVPNSVEPIGDVSHFRRLWRQRLGIMDNDILVLGVGRLSEQKNFGRFIEAVAIARKNAGIKAVVAGRDDGCLESLERQAARLGLDADVLRFIGLVPDAREVMCAADIFLLSSDYEGMPNVILEAMAARVACVSTRVNGVGDLIESGVSGFVTDHRSEDLADKMQLLALDEDLRRKMGEEAAKRVAHSFEPEHTAAQLWQLCE